MNEVSRQIEGKPSVPERPRLKARGIRERDHQRAIGLEQLTGTGDRIAGSRDVLEAVPEDDRRPGALHVSQLAVEDVGST